MSHLDSALASVASPGLIVQAAQCCQSWPGGTGYVFCTCAGTCIVHVCVCRLLIAVVSGSITMGMVFVYYARLLFRPQICLFLLNHSKQSH